MFAAAVIVTTAFWTVLPDDFHVTMATDHAGFYTPVARNIVAGNGITNRDGSPAIRYAPGYSLLLAPALWISDRTPISESAAISGITLLFVGLAAVSIFLLARRVFGGELALCAAALWITYPFVLWLTKEPMSAVPFMAFIYLALLAFWHASTRAKHVRCWFALVGVLIGASMLIRPIAMGLGGVLAILAGILRSDSTRMQRVVCGLMVLLGNFAVVAPWETWVYARTGQVILLSSGDTPSIVDGLTYAVREKGYRSKVTVPEDVRDLMEYLSDTLHSTDDGARPGARLEAREVSTLSDVVATLLGELRERPVTVIKLFAQKAVRCWYATDSSRYDLGILAIQSIYLALIVWGGAVAWGRNPSARAYVVLIATVTLYFWVMATLVLSILRYMVPAMGLLITLIPLGLPSRLVAREPSLAAESAT